MTKESLMRLGLDENQASIYLILIEIGPSPARKIYQKSGLKRSLIYLILDQLVGLGLVNKEDRPGKVATYSPAHPIKLKELITKKKQAIQEASQAIESILPGLISQFNLNSGAPGVSSLEGIAGLQKVYEDILSEKKDLLLFRSTHDNDDPEMEKLIQHQIKAQAARRIHTLALTPGNKETIDKFKDKDEQNLVTRRVIARDQFQLNSQVVVYGTKVAITTFRGPIISTVIDNEDINETFRTIFHFFWSRATSS